MNPIRRKLVTSGQPDDRRTHGKQPPPPIVVRTTDQSYFREQADRCRRLARESSDLALQLSCAGWQAIIKCRRTRLSMMKFFRPWVLTDRLTDLDRTTT